MEKAIELMVDAHVRVGNRRALEDLKMHRQRLSADLHGRAGFDVSLAIAQRQIDEEIAAIEAGLQNL